MTQWTQPPRVVGVGNAIVDVLVTVDEAVIRDHQLTKGGMHLVDEAAVAAVYADVGPATEQSGGSVANTIAHLADEGVPCAFIGKVANDTFGRVFTHDLSALGVANPVPPATDGDGTGRSLVLITPDGQRTMCTYLGASIGLTAKDVAASLPRQFDVLLIEGYLWDAPGGHAAIAQALERAEAARAKVAVTLSDAGCVGRHLETIAQVMRRADILLANEAEACALTGEDNVARAVDAVAGMVKLAAVTHSENGSTVLCNGERHEVDAQPVARVVDSTGAGDAFAAGFLQAYLNGAPASHCAKVGGRLAARVIQHIGAREATRAVA